jgi:hypothetical protein
VTAKERVAWQIFRCNRSAESLTELLQTQGEEQRQLIVNIEITLFFQTQRAIVLVNSNRTLSSENFHS